jgi:hypothetical protein
MRCEEEHSKPDRTWSRDYCLLAALTAYGVTNFIAFMLAAGGAVHPPFDLLLFFTFVGPAAGTLSVLAVQAAGRGTTFHWSSVVGFVLMMALAACLNLRAVIEAAAAC